MVTCPVCGSDAPEGSRFCGYCGHALAPIIESENKGVEEKRGRAATIYGLAAVCVFIFLVVVAVVINSLYLTSKTSAPTASNLAPATTSTPTPSTVPGLNIKSVNVALSKVGLNYEDFTQGNDDATYDVQAIGAAITISLTDDHNNEITNPSEDAAQMMVMVSPNDNQFTTGADGSPIYMPLTQNQIAAIRVILATLAEVNYGGANPNKPGKWEYQNFNSSSHNPSTIQIGPASISGSEANISGMPIYFLYIGTESQSNQNESIDQYGTDCPPPRLPAG